MVRHLGYGFVSSSHTCPWLIPGAGFLLSAKDALLRRDYRALFHVHGHLNAGFYWWYKTLSPLSRPFSHNDGLTNDVAL